MPFAFKTNIAKRFLDSVYIQFTKHIFYTKPNSECVMILRTSMLKELLYKIVVIQFSTSRKQDYLPYFLQQLFSIQPNFHWREREGS